MSNEETFLPSSSVAKGQAVGSELSDRPTAIIVASQPPSYERSSLADEPDSFWHNRLIEFGLMLSMALFYLIGNSNLKVAPFYHFNPLFGLPFLLIFCALSWYRLNFAIALLPLTLPFYLQQKVIYSRSATSGVAFSPAEITLAICLVIGLLQLVFLRKKWPFRQIVHNLTQRVGIFIVPITIFFLAALFSILIAYNRTVAMRAFREEVLDPLLYLVLALSFLRTRRDLLRLVTALFGTGLLIALIGVGQYLFFNSTLAHEVDGLRIHAMYGSANDIGLLFDYTLPPALALIVIGVRNARTTWESWGIRLATAFACIFFLVALYLTQSRGAEFALVAALALIIVCAVENRKALLIGALVVLVLVIVAGAFLGPKLVDTVINGHTSKQGVSTVTKRLYLWKSAWNMIQARPLTGFGMDNWLCYYSYNTVCHTSPHFHHYLINVDPVTHKSTDLKFEPTLSHPHEIFLQIWVSMGVFGVLAFVALIVLFFWLFIRMLRRTRGLKTGQDRYLNWITIGIGAAMLAALGQGLGDSSVLEQDLSFCFWTLLTILLLLRDFTGTPWRNQKLTEQETYKLPEVNRSLPV